MASQGRRIPMIVGAALLVCGAVVAILGGPHGGPEGGAADRTLPAGASPRLADATSSETGREKGPSRGLLAKPAPVAEAASVVVRVVDLSTRQPIPGVDVELERVDGASLGDARQTDARGRAVVGPVPEAFSGALVVHVHCPRCWPVDLRVPLSRAPGSGARRPDVEVAIRAPRTVRGVVVDAQGLPVVGAHIEGDRAETDEQGRFRLDDVVAGACRIRASRADLGEGSSLLDPGLGEVQIVIVPPAPRPEIRILGPSGHVPAVFELLWQEPGVGWEARVREPRIRAMLGGRLLWQGEAWDPRAWTRDAWLSVRDPCRPREAALAWGEVVVGPIRPGTETVDVTLGDARTLEGRALDAARKPVAGAVVRASIAPQGQGFTFPRLRHEAVTDAEGRFVLDGLGAARYRVRVAGGRGYAASEEVVVEGGSRGLELQVGAGVEVDLRVLHGEDLPVSGARVTLQFDEVPPGCDDSASWTTDDGGKVSLTGLAPESRGTLVVDTPDGRALLPHTEAGWTPRSDTIRLEPTLRITGTVTSPGGAPLAGATVAARGGPGYTWQQTSGDGRFQLPGFPEGPVVVWAYFGFLEGAGAGQLPFPWMHTLHAKAGDTDLHLVVEPGEELTVLAPEVADSGDAVAVLCPGSRFDPTGRIVPSEAGQEGVFLFRGLVPGAEYTFWVHAPGPSRSALVPGLRAGPPRTVALSSSVTLRGRLTGAPALHNGAVIGHVGPLRTVAYVAPDGTFEFSGLPPGTYDLEATGSVPDHGEWSGTARATVGTPVEIPMKHASGPR